MVWSRIDRLSSVTGLPMEGEDGYRELKHGQLRRGATCRGCRGRAAVAGPNATRSIWIWCGVRHHPGPDAALPPHLSAAVAATAGRLARGRPDPPTRDLRQIL
jgi:hypothetical protein